MGQTFDLEAKSPSSYVRVLGFKSGFIPDSIDTHHGKLRMMVQVAGSLPSTWET